MSKTRYRNNVPPGLRAQITFAVILTLGALLVLPTALSARQVGTTTTAPQKTAPSAGTVVTSVQDFHTAGFAAAEFSDWD